MSDHPMLRAARAKTVFNVNMRERFIPIERQRIADRLIESDHLWPKENRDIAGIVLNALARIRQQESLVGLDRLMIYYEPFNPDSALHKSRKVEKIDTVSYKTHLLDEVTGLVESANFVELTEQELESVLSRQKPYGVAVDVDLTEFEFFRLYFRGSSTEMRSRRDWRTLMLRTTEYETPIFERLFLMFKLKTESARVRELMLKRQIGEGKASKRLKTVRSALARGVSSDNIYIKLFKNIAHSDLEMLFPNLKVKLSYQDKLWLGVTAGGSVLTGLFGFVVKIVTALTSPILFIIAVGGLISVIVGQIMSFINTRNRYMMVLAQNLYFHSFANNKGVVTLMIDDAEEEDIKQQLLLYSFLANAPNPLEAEEVKRRIERFLRDEFELGDDFEFEINGSVQALKDQGVLIVSPEGKYSVLPLLQARQVLLRSWRHELDKRDEAPSMEPSPM